MQVSKCSNYNVYIIWFSRFPCLLVPQLHLIFWRWRGSLRLLTVIVPVQSRSRSREHVNKPKTARGSVAQTCSTPQFCPPTSLTHDPSCEESKPRHSWKGTEKPSRQKTKTERVLKSIKSSQIHLRRRPVGEATLIWRRTKTLSTDEHIGYNLVVKQVARNNWDCHFPVKESH